MEKAFLSAWENARKDAADLGVRLRPTPVTLENARRALSGNRESDGFWALEEKGRLDLSLEALAVKKAFTPLFSDEAANTALLRLLAAGYCF